jgi:hypothetical protein
MAVAGGGDIKNKELPKITLSDLGVTRTHMFWSHWPLLYDEHALGASWRYRIAKVIRHREPHAIWLAGVIDVCTDAEVQIPKSEQQPENAINANRGRKNLSFIIVLSPVMGPVPFQVKRFHEYKLALDLACRAVRMSSSPRSWKRPESNVTA